MPTIAISYSTVARYIAAKCGWEKILTKPVSHALIH